MIEILPESKGNLVGARATGSLTHQDYEEILIPHLKKMMRASGKVRFLLELGQDFEGWTLEALWDDAKFGWSSRKNFERVALVGGSLWMDLGAKAGGLLMDGELRTFGTDRLQEAWDWIRSQQSFGEVAATSPPGYSDNAQNENGEPLPKVKNIAKETHTPKSSPPHKRRRRRH